MEMAWSTFGKLPIQQKVFGARVMCHGEMVHGYFVSPISFNMQLQKI
jgi:hypothetical protein